MCTYRIDTELGLVFKLIEGIWVMFSTIINFKITENIIVEYFSTIATGE